MARLYPGPVKIVDEAPWGRLHIDGNIVLPGTDGPARERRKLSFNGVVSVSVMVGRDGELEGDPEVSMFGLPETGVDGQAMEDIVFDVLDDVFDVLPKPKRRNDEVLEEFIYQAVRRAIDRQWGKKPLCMVSLHRI